jgi:hypothetical protein
MTIYLSMTEKDDLLHTFGNWSTFEWGEHTLLHSDGEFFLLNRLYGTEGRLQLSSPWDADIDPSDVSDGWIDGHLTMVETSHGVIG